MMKQDLCSRTYPLRNNRACFDTHPPGHQRYFVYLSNGPGVGEKAPTLTGSRGYVPLGERTTHGAKFKMDCPCESVKKNCAQKKRAREICMRAWRLLSAMRSNVPAPNALDPSRVRLASFGTLVISSLCSIEHGKKAQKRSNHMSSPVRKNTGLLNRRALD